MVVGRTLLLAGALLVVAAPGQIPTPTSVACVVIGTQANGKLNLTCVSPKIAAIALQGISGPNNTGGPCVKSDSSFGLFTQLPDGTCWPVVGSGNITVAKGGMVDPAGNSVAMVFRFVQPNGPAPVQPDVLAVSLTGANQ